ncbi:prolyl oligopeptidase family serine peptidase [Spirosoma sp. HMF4905]|uniref:Prolyl oligopeptidase family serine peptidase n=1 Tax=Spirosoma arboris TaxID=2682092 RepID=A0A7K1SBI2_9BACT|nr:prolyl oligopeptidase family serine peptidase [Spirosoma arboris]MVM31131.1 prolyl oligopeptidase family serine peptidase [Spirosoma arboris]
MALLTKIKRSLFIWIAIGLVVLVSSFALIYWLGLGSGSQSSVLYGQAYSSPQLTQNPILVVVLHGDAPFNKPTYQYKLAQQGAQQNNNVVAVGLLRPGYTDLEGHHSAGQRGWTTSDNYTPSIIKAVVLTIQDLKKRYHPRKIVVAGHSGGAVITADVMSQYPDLVQATLLVSCPCDVDAFRRHMADQQNNLLWRIPVERLSPIELVHQVSPSTQITLVTGSIDSIALPTYTYRYATLLRNKGISVKTVTLANQGHEIFLRPEVLLQLKELINL